MVYTEDFSEEVTFDLRPGKRQKNWVLGRPVGRLFKGRASAKAQRQAGAEQA